MRIHRSSRTFVYFNGTTREAKELAARRSLWFHAPYFASHILGNAQKAETHRFAHENSEDALTWNVFSQLESNGNLGDVVQWMLPEMFPKPPSNVELYLWGLRISVRSQSSQGQFSELVRAREVYEKGIVHYHTEPDIMLHVPDRLLLLIEAKFTSGNTIASASGDKPGEKPKTISGLLQRYSVPPTSSHAPLAPASEGPFFSQLYRNLVFAIYMAAKLKIDWAFGNLTSARQMDLRSKRKEYKNPRTFVLSMIPAELHGHFVQPTWEGLEAAVIRGRRELHKLSEYLRYKSAYCKEALSISGAAVEQAVEADDPAARTLV